MAAPNAGFVWSIADMLRGPFKPKEYGKVILPFTVLARLDAVLAPTKRAVLDILPTVENRPELVRERLLRDAARASFYTSRYSLRSLGDPAQLAGNLKDLVDGFDPATREIFDKFNMHKVIDDLDTYDRLAMITKEFAFKLDVHPTKVSNAEMGTLFEELIRRFMESSKETAGEHFTPREVIRLMVGLLFSADDENLAGQTPMRQVYDPTCGTGGMLSVAEDWIAEHAPHVKLTLAGQEQNAETYAIAKADMLIKGHNVDNLVHGDTLTKPGHTGQTFSYCLANPPFGVDWKVQREAVEKERDRDGDTGRFAAGLPPVNDGSMLFLQHLVSKMHPVAQGGGRAAIVLNGSPLFTGGAGSGPSEIRRHLIEHDLVEAIIGLPTDMFYNTGIATYIWVLTNRKTPERQGKIQLIDATGMWVKMRKSLGSKRRELSDEDIDRIITLHGQFTDADPEHSRVLDNTEFGYRTITVERPLRQVFTITDNLIEEAMAHRMVGKLDKDAQHQLRHALESLDGGRWTRENDFRIAIRKTGFPVTEPLLKALVAVFGNSDEAGELVTDRRHHPLPDPSLRDTENVPIDQDIHDYLDREVLPWVPDAWLDATKTKTGYEIPFTRVFYQYMPPRPLAEIDADLQTSITRIEAMLAEVRR